VGGLSKADLIAKADHDNKLLEIALDAVEFIAQTIRRISYFWGGFAVGGKCKCLRSKRKFGCGGWI
jgi:hypothetical protein